MFERSNLTTVNVSHNINKPTYKLLNEFKQTVFSSIMLVIKQMVSAVKIEKEFTRLRGLAENVIGVCRVGHFVSKWGNGLTDAK